MLRNGCSSTFVGNRESSHYITEALFKLTFLDVDDGTPRGINTMQHTVTFLLAVLKNGKENSCMKRNGETFRSLL